MSNFLKRLAEKQAAEHGPKLGRLLVGLGRGTETEGQSEGSEEKQKPRGLPFSKRRQIN